MENSVGIRVDWDNVEPAILRYTVTDQWTWEEFYAVRDQARQMAEGIQREQINCIIDIHAGSPFPPNALLHFRRMPASAHPKFKFGTVVIIGDNPFVKTLMDIMRHLNRQAMQNFHLAKTEEEARAILRQQQEPASRSGS
jgi:hypothetical protein